MINTVINSFFEGHKCRNQLRFFFNVQFLKLGLTMARVGDLNADDVAVGVNTIQEIITATEEAGFSIPRTVTIESYR